jgi:hypothetical protein
VGGKPRDRRGAGRDVGDLVGEPERALGDHVDLVTDLDVLPVARFGPARGLGQYVILDGLEFGLGPRMRYLHRA